MSSIEAACLDDLPQLCDLLALLFAAEAEFTPDAGKQETALRAILASPETGRIFVLRENRRVVAMACLLFAVSTAEGGRAAWLEDVIVAPDRRGAGVGASLLSGVIEEARRLGCLRLTLLTDGDNTTARRFYARAGFQTSHMVPMRLKLSPG